MSRSAANAPASNTNAAPKTISRDDHRALLNHHMGKLRAARAQVEEARAPFDEAKDGLTALFHEARADLGKRYTRKRLASLLEDATSRLRDLLREEQERFQDRSDLGLPVYGTQVDLFGDESKTPAPHRDAIFWEAEGYLIGRRAGDRKAPEGCPPEHDTAFLKGYDRGQGETQKLFVEGVEARKRLAQPDAGAAPKDLNTPKEPEPGTPEAAAAERKSVSAAKESLAQMGSANQAAA